MLSVLQLIVVLLVCVLAGQCGELAKSADNAEATRNCGEGWFHSLELNECYYVSTNYTTFEEAVTFCEDVGGTLLSVRNAAEYDIVSLLIGQENLVDPYWIGLKPYSYYPYFRWLDNVNANYAHQPSPANTGRMRIPDAHWLDGITPSLNDTETCFAWLKTTTNNGWLPANCQQTLPYICKRHTKVDSYFNGYDKGSLHSPHYPKPYYANSISEHYIRLDGYSMTLTFDVLSIDPKSTIYVYENSVLINIVTSRSPPPTITLSTNQLLLRFDASKEGKEKYTGWKVSFSEFVPISTKGSFTSPNYPGSFFNDRIQLTKGISVPMKNGILFSFWDFYTESPYDHLTITALDNEHLFYLSGTNVTTPFTFKTDYNGVLLRWNSDDSNVARGFNITYVAVRN